MSRAGSTVYALPRLAAGLKLMVYWHAVSRGDPPLLSYSSPAHRTITFTPSSLQSEFHLPPAVLHDQSPHINIPRWRNVDFRKRA
jgi:hypothetical protein